MHPGILGENELPAAMHDYEHRRKNIFMGSYGVPYEFYIQAKNIYETGSDQYRATRSEHHGLTNSRVNVLERGLELRLRLKHSLEGLP